MAAWGARRSYVYPVDGGAGSFGSPEVFEALTDDDIACFLTDFGDLERQARH